MLILLEICYMMSHDFQVRYWWRTSGNSNGKNYLGILTIILKSEIEIKGVLHVKQAIAGMKLSKDDKKT